MTNSVPNAVAEPSPSRAARRSYHPGLNALLEKLHQGASLSDAEAEERARPRHDLNEHPRGERHAPGVRFRPVAPVEGRLPSHATADGGARFAKRCTAAAPDFHAAAQDLLISGVGIGTYRGALDAGTDEAYVAAIHAALRLGVNVVDTAINYRDQRSERCVAAALRRFLDDGDATRDEIVVCTKGGFIVQDAFTPGCLEPGDVSGGVHAIAPAFLADQIERSRHNLGLQTIDVYYLHNPETQLATVGARGFADRLRRAFAALEQAVADGAIRYYGTATWGGLREGRLSLESLADLAREVGGDRHHLRFVQLPFNLGMQEAATRPRPGAPSVIELADQLGITVIASAGILQARLARGLPEALRDLIPGLESDAQRAIQFSRSTPRLAW